MKDESGDGAEEHSADSADESTCAGCAKVISEGSVIAFGEGIYHLDCFRCVKCDTKIDCEQSNILLSDGLPMCQHCSYICAVCRKPIVDEAIMTGADAYHASCFNCVICKKKIESATFAKSSNGIYCMACLETRRQKKKNNFRGPNLESGPSFRHSIIEPLSSLMLGGGGVAMFSPASAPNRAAVSPDHPMPADKEWYSAQEVLPFRDQISALQEELSIAHRQIEAFRALNERALHQINQATEEVNKEVLRRQTVESLLGKLQLDYANLLRRIRSSDHPDDPSLAALLEDAEESGEQIRAKMSALASRRASIFNPRELKLHDVPLHAATANEIPHLATVTVRSSSLKNSADAFQPRGSDVLHADGASKRTENAGDVSQPQTSALVRALPPQRSSSANDAHNEAESVTVKKATTKNLTTTLPEKAKPRVLRWMPRGPRPRQPREHLEKSAHCAEEEEPANGGHATAHTLVPHLFRRPTRCKVCSDKMWSLQTRELRCQRCGYHVHNKCVSNVTDACAGSSPECNSTDDGNSPRAKGARVFGRELEQQVECEQNEIPGVVEKCILAVEQRGMEVEGIYRKTGSTAQMRLLQSLFEKGEPPDLLDEEAVDDVTTITSLLKLYLRELPEPLLTFKLYEDWIELLEIEEHGLKLNRIQELLQLLPTVNRLTLKRLCLHLAEVANFQEINRMSAKNLSMVFGPTLMHCTDNEKDMFNTNSRNTVVYLLIMHVTELFSGDEKADNNTVGVEENINTELDKSASA